MARLRCCAAIHQVQVSRQSSWWGGGGGRVGGGWGGGGGGVGGGWGGGGGIPRVVIESKMALNRNRK